MTTTTFENQPSCPVIQRTGWSGHEKPNPEKLVSREWLVTNGLGGYASGTVSGICTRRYHGLLIAALPPPLGRTMMFNHIIEEIRLPDASVIHLGGKDHSGYAFATLEEFSLECGLPRWFYRAGEFRIEKRVVMPYRSNTVHLIYRMLQGDEGVRLRLRPGFHFRPHESAVARANRSYAVVANSNRVEIRGPDLPALRMILSGHRSALVLDGGQVYDVEYPLERDRGYPYHDALWSPGYFRSDLAPGKPVTLSASTEDWEVFVATSPVDSMSMETERQQRLLAQATPAARTGMAAELVLAADQFLITPTARIGDAARIRAAGDELRAVIAGYHWFTDWGRDTMISLEGLTLVTGRQREAGYLLRAFAHYVRDGLIPNLFPEGEQTGRYNTADATLWYFHALERYLKATDDRVTLQMLLPTLRDIIEHHLRGTRFGIGVDPADGLLRQGEEGYQLTWMDAKVDDWVVTPRRGKAVEINALWYNALVLYALWLSESGETGAAEEAQRHAERARESFNRRFWCAGKRCLYDVVDCEQGGDDASFRPNQVFAISLPHPVLDREHWQAVMDSVTDRLLTPVGLRTLAPGEPQYKPTYDGDLRARDAAYHQGTVWPWLIGPYIDAWLKVYPDKRDKAHEMIASFGAQLGEACVGSISEIHDAEKPYLPRGCIAQAWSVAELLRCWVKTTPETDSSPEA